MRRILTMLRGSLSRSVPMSDSLDPEGERGLEVRGHREYVGGLWEPIGQLQFDFLRARGLRPDHYLLDIACGALRLGVKAIPYLEPGHYLGIEKERSLIRAGLEQELGEQLRRSKAPRILCDSQFRFGRLRQSVDVAIAQSLFTHLPPALIERCLERLRPCLRPDGVLYATFFEAQKERANPSSPHDHGFFAYTRAQMEAFGHQHAYRPEYIGGWNHPRDQVMMAYRPAR